MYPQFNKYERDKITVEKPILYYVYVVIEFLYLSKTSYKYFTFKKNVNETNEMRKQNNGDRMCNLPVNELENKGTSEEKTNCKLVSGRVEITELRN